MNDFTGEHSPMFYEGEKHTHHRMTFWFGNACLPSSVILFFLPVPGFKPQLFQPSEKLNSKVSLWQGDITGLEIDAIVNSIHGDESDGDYDSIRKNGTVADCIYKAGGQSLFTELVNLMESSANIFEYRPVMITRGYQLPAKCTSDRYLHGISSGTGQVGQLGLVAYYM